jgi:hypothetical protein
MAMDNLKSNRKIKRSAPQCDWTVRGAEALIGLYERYSKEPLQHRQLLSVLSQRFNEDRWDEESRILLVRKGFRIPTTIEEVKAAEEALANEPVRELPESLKDPYKIIAEHPEVFGRK